VTNVILADLDKCKVDVIPSKAFHEIFHGGSLIEATAIEP
jgi:hypothetical protein